MPKETILWQHHIAVEHDQEPDHQHSPPGEVVMKDIWRFVFTDKRTGDEVRISFTKEVRDSIVRSLMGGIAMPGNFQL